MKNWREYLILLLFSVLAIGYVIHLERSKESDLSIQKLKGKAKTDSVDIAHSKAITDTLKIKLSVIEKEHIVKEGAKDKEIQALKSRIAFNRTKAMEQVADKPEARELINDLDSLNEEQEQKTDIVKQNCSEDIAVLTAITNQQDSTIVKQDSLILDQSYIIKEQRKVIKRETKLTKFLTRFGVPAAFVIGLLVAL